jgi:AcrR family transcriptional regulator
VSSSTQSDKESLILETTLNLIAARGFHDTPMSLIAKKSGVSAGIIYHYFENKEDLIRGLYRRIKMRFSAAIMDGNPQDMPFPNHVKHIWLKAYHFYLMNPKEALFLEQYENSPFANGNHDIPVDANMEMLYALIRQDYADHLIRELPFEALYQLTLGVAVGLAKQHIAGLIDLDEATLNTIADSCCRAIQP